MNAVFKQRGDAIDHIPAADVNAGDVVVQNDLVGIAKLDIKAGERGALALTGVYAMPKAAGAGTAIAAGVKLHWNAGGALATPDADDGGTPPTAFPYLGKSILEAGDDEATVQVRLDQ
jgi:predicted RecA/RadA family phage recombinase